MLWQFPDNLAPDGFSSLAREFLLWTEAELTFSRETVGKYGECLKQVWFFWGERSISAYSEADLMNFRLHLRSRELSISRQTSLLLAIKRFLSYCADRRKMQLAIDPAQIKPPRRPRREVTFLTPEEVECFIASIPLRTTHGESHIAGLRLRALVEVLLGSAMRISEALSLNRDTINFKEGEAVIIGKGNRQRTVFLTARALHWVKRYADQRTDDCPALFVCQDGKTRLKRDDLWRYFDRYCKLAGINKRVTPHILRHTAATQLLFNGCPVGHIKEILGHERLETTCRY